MANVSMALHGCPGCGVQHGGEYDHCSECRAAIYAGVAVPSQRIDYDRSFGADSDGDDDAGYKDDEPPPITGRCICSHQRGIHQVRSPHSCTGPNCACQSFELVPLPTGVDLAAQAFEAEPNEKTASAFLLLVRTHRNDPRLPLSSVQRARFAPAYAPDCDGIALNLGDLADAPPLCLVMLARATSRLLRLGGGA